MFSRRYFLKLSSAMAGSVVISTAVTGCSFSARRPALSSATFLHGIASGDPQQDRLLLWTRAAPVIGEASLNLLWEVAEDHAFTRVIRNGAAQATADRDYTVKIDVQDLAPGTEYFYRFSALDETTVTGRGKTLPEGDVAQVRLAVFSCSNYPAGYFHSYREGSRVEGLDAFLHLGDYLYEYGAGGYATERAGELGRDLAANNAGELHTLNDYRRRYALYRTDKDLQAMHAAAPCIAVWDDHEVANDAWMDGAENHSLEEGDYGARKLAAIQAYYEWLPIRPPAGDGSEQIYRSFDFGTLLSLHMLDTRIIGRDQQLEYGHYVDPDTGAMDQARFRADLLNPDRSLLGREQLQWLGMQVAGSTARWQLLGQQVLMGKMNLPAEVLGAKDFSSLPPMLGELAELKAGMVRGAQLTTEQQQRLARVTPYNLDAWDGYPVEREMLYGMVREQGKGLVVLAGDTHNAWHSSLLDQEGNHVGVELATPSVSSPGMETYFGTTGEQAQQLAEALAVLVDDLHYCNLHQRGYLVLTVTAQALDADWRFVDTVTEREYRAVDGHRQMIPAWQTMA